MPSLSLSNVAWSTPNGHPVLSALSLDFTHERVGLVGRNGVGKTTLLRLLTGELEPVKGCVECSGTVGTMRQMVQVPAGQTVADVLGISDALALLRRAEEGVASVNELVEADWSVEARAMEALAQVGLRVSLTTELTTLSGGQRTRASLAGAVFNKPDFLLLDEPTNDLDRDGRLAVRELLETWRAGAIVVSHDRELLDTLDAIVELTTIGATRYGGNWTAYQARKEAELSAAERDLAASQRRMAEMKRTAQRSVERQHRRDASGKRKASRGDMPRILAGARRDRAEKSSGENARLVERQLSAGAEELARARGRVERIEMLAVTLAPTGLASSQRVLEVRDLTHGYGPVDQVIRDISFAIVGPERVAVIGPNGCGKSTLLALIAGRLLPRSGCAEVHVPFAFIDQRMGILDPALTIEENFSSLNPGADENARRAILARFQFRAESADQLVGTLSGGQMLRAGLACVLGSPKPPALLILDEPTNHLDLDSIEAVEAGLRAFDGALLIVSHDDAFLHEIRVNRRVLLN